MDTDIWDSELALANAGGDADLRRELVELFLSETPQLLAELTSAVERRDTAAATRLAHGIKGSAATLGAKRVRDTAQLLETAGKSVDWNTFQTQVPVLQTELQRLSVVLGDPALV